jgi:transglutaminase-like putative cysteine protease
MIQYIVNHVTTYDYSEPVSLCQNVAHLTPRHSERQYVDNTVLTVSPEPAVFEERLDYFGNPAAYFVIQEPHKQLVVNVSHRIAVQARAQTQWNTAPWESIRDQLRVDRSSDWIDAYQFSFDSRHASAGRCFAEYADASFGAGRSIADAAFDLTRRISRDFVYDAKATTSATPVMAVFENRRGVCQDFAHIQLACLRSLGLAARYVSGYLSTVPPPGRPRLVGADATHAWISVFCGDAGWLDLDPTNNQSPSDRHILIAWGRDFEDVSPLKGVILGGGSHEVRVSVDVAPAEVMPSPS